MRRFRFVGDPNMFDWDLKPVLGDIYPETHFGTKKGIPFTPVFANGVDTDHWQEVFDHIGLPTPKPLHKDTDLGYFAGLAMRGLLSDSSLSYQTSDWAEKLSMDSIKAAKELIKQLDLAKSGEELPIISPTT